MNVYTTAALCAPSWLPANNRAAVAEVFSPDCGRRDRILSEISIYLKFAIVHIGPQLIPPFQRVAHGYPDRAFRKDFGDVSADPLAQ